MDLSLDRIWNNDDDDDDDDDDRLLPGVGWNCSSILLLVANGHHNCIKCTNADVRLRTPDDGRNDCPKHVVVIPINLEFSASVGFIHKEFATMHGHTILRRYHMYRYSITYGPNVRNT